MCEKWLWVPFFYAPPHTWSRFGPPIPTAPPCYVIWVMKVPHMEECSRIKPPKVIVYLQTRGGHCGTAGAGLPNASTPLSLSLSPSSQYFPPSLTPPQWSQQCCRDMPATLIIALGEERGMQQEREKGSKQYRPAGHRGWCWRIWHLFHSWWNSRSGNHRCAYKETTM